MVIRKSHFLAQAVAIRSELSGGVHDVVIENCVFGGGINIKKSCIEIKAVKDRGGYASNVSIWNSALIGDDDLEKSVLTIMMLYGDTAGGLRNINMHQGNPGMIDISFSNLSAT